MLKLGATSTPDFLRTLLNSDTAIFKLFVTTMSVEENPSLNVCVPMPLARVDPRTGYFSNIDNIRTEEYPILQGQQGRNKSKVGADSLRYRNDLSRPCRYNIIPQIFGYCNIT